MNDAMNSAGNRCRTVVLEERYAYYRRCQAVRKNGVQCKAPALKGERICCKHQLQNELRQRWERQREQLRLPKKFHDLCTVVRALDTVGQAMIDGRIDEKPAGRLLWELGLVLSAIQRQMRSRIGTSGNLVIGTSGLSDIRTARDRTQRNGGAKKIETSVENRGMIWGCEANENGYNREQLTNYGD